MLSVWPTHFLSLFAYFILRCFVGFILFYLGIRHLQYHQELKQIMRLSWWPFGAISAGLLAMTEIILGSLLIVGAYTQIAALLVALLSLKLLFMRGWFPHHTIPPKLFYFLLLGASLSLIITGAGALAFDLPF